jgi:hypothetical protein
MSLQRTVRTRISEICRGINEFKRGHQPRNNLAKMRMVICFSDSHSIILNRWKNYFSQIFNVHNVSDVRQTEVHTVLLKLKLIFQG